ncbi:DUF6529 family protein [Candidatus Electronema sp. TJ]|uniref:DUF6529 family protein n=1 Tax=Candidatus Electronema sp. TJ TaxID=3401573 RepID=UPI003AA93FDE
MNPAFTSLAGLAAVLAGAFALLIMLELRGNPREDKEANQRLIRAHRAAGWLTAVLLLGLLAAMLLKADNYHEEFPPRILLHAALGLLLAPLLALKLLLVRRFKRLGTMAPGFGIALFLALFVLYSLTGGYYFLHQSAVGHALMTDNDDMVLLDTELGRMLLARKCVKCHSLERVFKASKSVPEWTATVRRMAVMDSPNIRSFDAAQIINYLTLQQERRERQRPAKPQPEKPQAESKGDGTLLGQKCTRCHSLDRVRMAKKSAEEWRAAVERMEHHADDPTFLSPEEKEAVLRLLIEQQTK